MYFKMNYIAYPYIKNIFFNESMQRCNLTEITFEHKLAYMHEIRRNMIKYHIQHYKNSIEFKMA